MLLYHTTLAAKEIIDGGFRDGRGKYMTSDIHEGVWLSDRPLDASAGAKGGSLLSLDIPENVMLKWEWVEERKGYREFLIPAEIVNRYGPPTVVDDDLDGMKAWRSAGG